MNPTLDSITLRKGSHASREAGMCAMEAAAYIAGEEHSDRPRCVSPVLTAFMVNWNDSLPSDRDRDRLLKPFLPRIIGTAGDGHDETRGWMALDWLVRVFSPAWLDLAGLPEHAQALRGLPEITAATREVWDGPLQERVSAACSAAAADAAAEAAACSEAYWAAYSAAGSAARSAAGSAAYSAAYWAADSAAYSAARSAAKAAALSAAKEVLTPVVVELQQSAVDLLDRMVALGEAERKAA